MKYSLEDKAVYEKTPLSRGDLLNGKNPQESTKIPACGQRVKTAMNFGGVVKPPQYP
jgi:hypothetical protein